MFRVWVPETEGPFLGGFFLPGARLGKAGVLLRRKRAARKDLCQAEGPMRGWPPVVGGELGASVVRGSP